MKKGVEMANLQIKGVDDTLYHQLKQLAASENRSVSQQVLYLIRSALAHPGTLADLKNPALILLELSGAWEDKRDAASIVADIRKSRIVTRKPAREL